MRLVRPKARTTMMLSLGGAVLATALHALAQEMDPDTPIDPAPMSGDEDPAPQDPIPTVDPDPTDPTQTQTDVDESVDENPAGAPKICSTAEIGSCKEYFPQFPLWSDGSVKRRFVALPGTDTIDTSDPDRWSFTKGTRFYKNFFDEDGATLLETRVITKVKDDAGAGSWRFKSYRWDPVTHEPQLLIKSSLDVPFPAEDDPNNFDKTSEAVNAPLGKIGHKVPSMSDCNSCHNMNGKDAVLGFGALQLNGTKSIDGDAMPYTLQKLVDDKRVDESVLQGATISTDEATWRGIGYLHGNCGNCHAPGAQAAGTKVRLRAEVNKEVVPWNSQSTRKQPVIETAICKDRKQSMDITVRDPHSSMPELKKHLDALYYIDVGKPESSFLFGRMQDRSGRFNMPRIATQTSDVKHGIPYVEAWIKQLAQTDPPCAAKPAPQEP